MIRDVLEELGYRLSDDGGFWRTSSDYRAGSTKTSLRINKENGNWQDFGNDSYGNLFDLIKLTLGLKDSRESMKWLDGKYNLNEIKPSKPKMKVSKVFDRSVLSNLFPNYTHYLTHQNPIREEVLKEFECGLATTGKLRNRICFPIICHENQDEILGFCGRDVTGHQIVKWKIINPKFDWQYPRFLSEKYIEKLDEVIIVESIGDAISLWNAGVKNVLVSFGIILTKGMIKALLELNPKRITIALNNEPENGNKGLVAAEKFKTKLLKIFDDDRVILFLPTGEDFGAMTESEVSDWNKSKEEHLKSL